LNNLQPLIAAFKIASASSTCLELLIAAFHLYLEIPTVEAAFVGKEIDTPMIQQSGGRFQVFRATN